MIVPSMTYDEMRKEFIHDLHIASAKAQHTFRGLLFSMHKRHQKHAVETVTWKSALHNTWMSVYNLDPLGADMMHVCITMDHGNLLKTLHSMNFSTEEKPFIAEFNIHFFKRYNE